MMQNLAQYRNCVSRVCALVTTLALAVWGSSQVVAGEISLEWAVDAGCTILEAEIIKAEKPIGYRVTAIMKDTSGSRLVVGSFLEHDFARGKERVGDRAVLFLFENEQHVHGVINLARPYPHPGGKGECLAINRSGKGMSNPEEVLTTIRQRVEQRCKQNGEPTAKVCKDGLTVMFKNEEPVTGGFDNYDDDNEGQYSVLLPPDSPAELKIAKDARLIFECHNNLSFAGQYVGWYWPKTVGASVLAKHEADLHRIAGFVKKTWKDRKPSAGATRLASGCNKISSDGKMIALAQHGIVSVVEVANMKTVYQSIDGPKSANVLSLIFSPKNEYFAHLHFNGDVTTFDLEKRQVRRRFEFPWPLGKASETSNPGQFSFSPDLKYIALNMSAGIMGWGSALVVWRADSGECVFTKSPNWELRKQYHITGFGPDSKNLRYEETSFWNIEEGRPVGYVGTSWSLPIDGPEPLYEDSPRKK